MLGRSEFSLGEYMIVCLLFSVCVCFWPVKIKIVSVWGLLFVHITSI